MSTFDSEALLRPISEEQPCGVNLEDEPAFLDLERRVSALGDVLSVGPDEPVEPPDWRAIAVDASQLLARSKDVRVAVTLTKALLQLDGVSGLSRGLSLVDALLTRYWDALHPQLGAEPEDAVRRGNLLRELCDLKSVIWPLRAAPLLRLPGTDGLSFRELGNGKLPDVPESCSAELQGSLAALKSARASLRALEARASEALGQEPLRLEALASLLEQMERALLRVAPPESEPAVLETPQPMAASVVAPTPAIAHSRHDVVRILDGLCGYYAQHEPCSPIPMLLHRARRLVSMSFIDVVRELAPGGLAEIETLRGPITTEES